MILWNYFWSTVLKQIGEIGTEKTKKSHQPKCIFKTVAFVSSSYLLLFVFKVKNFKIAVKDIKL